MASIVKQSYFKSTTCMQVAYTLATTNIRHELLLRKFGASRGKPPTVDRLIYLRYICLHRRRRPVVSLLSMNFMFSLLQPKCPQLCFTLGDPAHAEKATIDAISSLPFNHDAIFKPVFHSLLTHDNRLSLAQRMHVDCWLVSPGVG